MAEMPTSDHSDHAELVRRAVRWLQNTVNCDVVLHEFAVTFEIPDAIGWGPRFKSYLVECKASRSDFLADAQKPFRRHPELGMGVYRYYMTYPTLIRPEELPHRWGLLWVYPKIVKVVRPAFPFDARDAAVAELPLLCAALRRVALRGDLEKIYTIMEEEQSI